MKTDYENVKSLESQFDKFWVPYDTWIIGSGESGVKCYGIIDKKSERIYLEQYDPISDSKKVQAFDRGNYPDMWPVDEDGSLEKRINIPN